MIDLDDKKREEQRELSAVDLKGGGSRLLYKRVDTLNSRLTTELTCLKLRPEIQVSDTGIRS